VIKSVIARVVIVEMTAKRGLFRRNLGNPGCREEIELGRRSCVSEWSAGFLLEDFTRSCETSGDIHTKHFPLAVRGTAIEQCSPASTLLVMGGKCCR
jgi:hypothetical protein